MINRMGGLPMERPVALLAVAFLIVVRLDSFDLPPTWDAAMSVWPAAFEISTDWDLARVIDLPPYGEGGPNTHTLSLFTLFVAVINTWFGPETTFVVVHLVGVTLAVGLGLLVGKALRLSDRHRLAPWGVGLVCMFPMVVGQSAYLYTELPSTFFAFLAGVFAFQSKIWRAVLSLTVAVWIKPLAIVVVPAVSILIWRQSHKLRHLFAPLFAVVGIVPSLFVPIPGPVGSLADRLFSAMETSWAYVVAAPELIFLLLLPYVAFVTLRLTGGLQRVEVEWLIAFGTLVASFILFFSLNGLVTAGLIFIPRYATLLIPFAVVLLLLSVDRVPGRAKWAILVTMLALAVLGVRGPFAWGSNNPAHPMAERSLAFVTYLGEQKEGLIRLAELSYEMPVFYDHYAHFGYTYRELHHFDGRFNGGTPVHIASNGVIQEDALPNRFAMLVGFPFVGGEKLRALEETVRQSSDFVVSSEKLGIAMYYPLELIIVERVAS